MVVKSVACGRVRCQFRSSLASVSRPNWHETRLKHERYVAVHLAKPYSTAWHRSIRSSTATELVPCLHILNVSFPGFESDVVIDAWKDLVAISNGAACTSQSYTCSHVLSAMQLQAWRRDGAIRFSWCATTEQPEWHALVAAALPYRMTQAVETT